MRDAIAVGIDHWIVYLSSIEGEGNQERGEKFQEENDGGCFGLTYITFKDKAKFSQR
jgi:hypothetical protein